MAEEIGRVIRPMAEFVFDADVVDVEMKMAVKQIGAERGGVYVSESMRYLDLWSYGVHFWLEIVFGVGVLVLIWQLMRLWRRRGVLTDVRENEPYCRKCGYGLMGLEDDELFCPECGVEGIGEGGRERRVRRGRLIGERVVRWGAVAVVILMMTIVSLLWYGGENLSGQRGRWRWVETVAKWMGDHGSLAGYVNGQWDLRYSIRDIGVSRWLSIRSGLASRMIHQYGSDWLKGFTRWHEVWGGDLVVLDIQGDEVVRRPMIYDDGVSYAEYQYLGDSLDNGPNRVDVPEWFVWGDGLWYYEPIDEDYDNSDGHHAGRFYLVDGEAAMMRRFVATGIDDLLNESNGRDYGSEVRIFNTGYLNAADETQNRMMWRQYEVEKGVYLVHGEDDHYWDDWEVEEDVKTHVVMGFDLKRKQFASVMAVEKRGESAAYQAVVGDAWGRVKQAMGMIESRVDEKKVAALIEVIGEEWRDHEAIDAVVVEDMRRRSFEYSRGYKKNDFYDAGRRLLVDKDGRLYADESVDCSGEVVREIGRVAVHGVKVGGAILDDIGQLWIIGKHRNDIKGRCYAWVYDVSEVEWDTEVVLQ
ncbi:hypothetical protein KS4_33530 [Poriferisphaera corsica]|uniref:Uncharacterized protein n=1 Tax=Poriferisphaera corsica TaxID=2528020 RepID=A0A517YYG4_9BACT|nr:zinc ribbon domain-containing protein [Poriferisphaera corsica]QDU35272.1 hypothetical protein KS4_33530 [Poriferisphaera corsica]